jgi:hypothetical protein
MKDMDELIRGALSEEAGRTRFDPSRWEGSVTELPAPRRPRLHGLRPVPRALAGVAVAAVLAAAIAGPLLLLSRLGSGPRQDRPGQTVSPTPTPTGYVRHADLDDGLSIQIPATWTFHQDPSGPAEPRTVFAVGSWRFPRGGDCAPTAAQVELPSDGVFFWLIEYGDPQGNDFPTRRERFELDQATLAHYECSVVPSSLIRFQDAGRSFQVHVAFGPDASDSQEREALDALDSLKVTAPVPDGCPPQVASSGDPDCPEHAWLEAVVETAGYKVAGNTGSAVIGKAGGVEFAIWTTEADPDDQYVVPPEAGFDEEIYITYQNVADITVYTDGTRFVWTVQGFHVWVEENVGGPLRVRAIEPLVGASLTVDYDAIDTRP